MQVKVEDWVKITGNVNAMVQVGVSNNIQIKVKVNVKMKVKNKIKVGDILKTKSN